MKILVTGGAGFIGTNFVEFAKGKGDEVLVIDKAATVTKSKVDIRDYPRLRESFERFKPEIVIHLAALASPPLCETDCDECMTSNINGTVNVARLAKEYGSRMVFASSAAAYGKPKDLPTKVTSEIAPANFYGLTKVVDESIIRYYLPDNHTIFRIFNVYGEKCDRSYVIPDTIRKILQDSKNVPMLGTGDEERDFVYIRDVCECFYAASKREDSGTYNLGTGKSISIKQLVSKISTLMGFEDTTFSFAGKTRIGDINKMLADVSNNNVLPDWKPKVDIDTGLYNTIEYFHK